MYRIGARRPRWNALEILALRGVSVEDRLYAVLRPQLVPEPVLRVFGADCVERVLKQISFDREEFTQVVAEALRIARLYAAGKTSDVRLAEHYSTVFRFGASLYGLGTSRRLAATAASFAIKPSAYGPAHASRYAARAIMTDVMEQEKAPLDPARAHEARNAEWAWQIKHLRKMLRDYQKKTLLRTS